MTLANIKSMKEERGFTIVELLIVIVIIAILAAIVIVAYNGVQNRAKTSAGQSTANSIVKKFEALNAVKGAYYSSSPTAGISGADINTYATASPVVNEAKIDNTASVIPATNGTTSGLDGTSAKNGNTVAVFACTAGANVWYWDYAASPAAAVQMKAGPGC